MIQNMLHSLAGMSLPEKLWGGLLLLLALALTASLAIYAWPRLKLFELLMHGEIVRAFQEYRADRARRRLEREKNDERRRCIRETMAKQLQKQKDEAAQEKKDAAAKRKHRFWMRYRVNPNEIRVKKDKSHLDVWNAVIEHFAMDGVKIDAFELELDRLIKEQRSDARKKASGEKAVALRHKMRRRNKEIIGLAKKIQNLIRDYHNEIDIVRGVSKKLAKLIPKRKSTKRSPHQRVLAGDASSGPAPIDIIAEEVKQSS